MVGIQPIVRAAQQVSTELLGPPLSGPATTSHDDIGRAFARFAQLLTVTEPFVGDVVNRKPAPQHTHNDLLKEAASMIQALHDRIGRRPGYADTEHISDLVRRLDEAAG